MKIARITLWDGRVFYTDRVTHASLRTFFDRVRATAQNVPDGATNQVDLIEMAPEEYASIPATKEAAMLFGDDAASKQCPSV